MPNAKGPQISGKIKQLTARMTRAERAVLVLLFVFGVKLIFSTVAHFLPVLQGIDLLGSGKPLDVWLTLLCITAVLGVYCLYRRARLAADVSLTRFEWAVLAGICLLSAVFYLKSMWGRQILYLWDNATYYNLQVRLESNFADGVFTGVGSTIYKTWFNDYAPLVINLLTELFYMLGNRTANTFALTCALLIPSLVYYSAALLLAALRRRFAVKAPRAFFTLGMGSMALLPLFHIALYCGMPDLLGVAWALMLLTLAVGYDFEHPAPARLVCMATYTGLLILTRRCYLFWAAAFFGLYGVWVLLRAARTRQPAAAVRLLKFAGVSLACVGGPLVPMFWRIVRADYASRYATYQTGGFWAEILHQERYLGGVMTAVFLVGCVYGLCRKRTRPAALLALLGAPFTLYLVTRVQNMDDHQSLAVLPFYLLGFWLCAAAVASLSQAWLRRRLVAVFTFFCVANFGAASALLPVFLPAPLYSGLFFYAGDVRDDLPQVREINDWLVENCPGENSAYMICHGVLYSPDVFRETALPDESVRKILPYGACNPGNDAFPKELLFADVVLTCTPFDPNNHTGTMNDAFLENQRLYAPFEVAAAFDMGNGTTITAYRRVKPATVAELATYRRYLAEEDAQFPYNFSDVWDALEPNLAP